MFAFRYPAVVILFFVIAGTLLGWQTDPGLHLLGSLLIAALAGLIYTALRFGQKYFIYPLGILILCGSYFGSTQVYQARPPDDIGKLVGHRQPIRFFGEIAKWPVIKRNKTIITCRVDSIVLDSVIMSSTGMIYVNLRRETTSFSLGDKITFSGKLGRPVRGGYPGQFDYDRYLFNKGIRGSVYLTNITSIDLLREQRNIFGKTVNGLRQSILECFRVNLRPIPAALASGFLIGETRDIPEDIYIAFRRTGTLHLLAVSGSNVALVLLVAIYLLRFFPLRRSVTTLLLLIIIIIFSNLSYNQPSVVRASVMACLVLVGRNIYRRTDLNNIIAATAALLILYDPANLFDIGFQLSFAVAWSLILFIPPINSLFKEMRMSTPLRYTILLISCSFIASLISAPITSYYFGQTSLITVFSNLLVVPLVSLTVIGITILLLTHLVLPALAIFPGMLLDRLLVLINKLVSWFSAQEFSALTTPSFPAVYVFVLLGGVILAFLSIRSLRMRRLFVFYSVISLGGWILIGALGSKPESGLEIFNRGADQAIFINEGGGMLIYHRRNESQYDGFNNGLVPYLKSGRSAMPEYIYFMEPRYRTNRRIETFSEKNPEMQIVPADEQNRYKFASLWKSNRDSSVTESRITKSISSLPGLAIFECDNQRLLIFAENVKVLNSIPAEQPGEIRFYIMFAATDSELEEMIDICNPEQSLILLERSWDYYKTLSGNEFIDNVVERGSNIKRPL